MTAMKAKHLALVAALLLPASTAAADHIVVNGRYIVAKADIRGYFYRERDQSTVFDVRWSDWSTRYRCDDAYDTAQVEAATGNLVLGLAGATSIDFGRFLEREGFIGCERF